MTCSHISESGQKCRANALKGGELCYFHSPETQAARLESSRKGGSRPKSGGAALVSRIDSMSDADVGTLAGLRELLSLAVNMLMERDSDPIQRGRALLYAVSVGGKLLELREFEKDLAELRELVEALPSRKF